MRLVFLGMVNAQRPFVTSTHLGKHQQAQEKCSSSQLVCAAFSSTEAQQAETWHCEAKGGHKIAL